jgi:hypothetical protein
MKIRSTEEKYCSVKKIHLILALLIIGGGMTGIELINGFRIWTDPHNRWEFPIGYVSQGIYSFGAFIRQLDKYNTDIAPSLNAALKLRHHNPALYNSFKLSGSSFIYPPSAAFLLMPFSFAIETNSGDLSVATQLVDISNRICVIIAVGIVLLSLRAVLISANQLILAGIILFCFFPLRLMLLCVQAQSFVTVFLIASIFAFGRSRNMIAGILLGLAACFKPHVSLLILFFILRKQWRCCAGMFISGILVIIGSLLLVGFLPWATYIREILPSISMGYAFYPNQSPNGIIHRWLGHPPVFTLGPKSELVSIITGFSAIFLWALAVFPRLPSPLTRLAKREQQTIKSIPWTVSSLQRYVLRELDLGLAVLAITLSSPITWEHHLAWTIILFSTCVMAISFAKFSASFLYGIVISYILIGTFFLPVKMASSGVISLINSPHFFGALMLFILAWYCYIKIYEDQIRKVGIKI